MHALIALALISASPARVGGDADQPRGSDRVRSYVSQPRPRSARFLDHGDIAIGVAGGTPHVYRLDLRVGLFDHVSVGVTGHWLPGQRAPQLWPVGAIAFWRFIGASNQVGFEVGAHYRPVLHPPVDPEQTFIPQTQFALGTMVVSAGPFSAGLDVGAAHVRIPVADPATPTAFDRRTVFGGGVFARIGTRRIGVSADALAALSPEPLLVFELMLDVRFGAFSERGI
ncbi:MAG TPA: hypothetical protein VM869_09480 [Enhygromyxa sp.]|nr:hypothetical protein [Enhygromyxa sp.]